jgi:2-dehydropantoate 2-reductase
MRIMFVGVGALGSYFGGALAEGGHDVTLLIRNKAHRDAIRADGLILHRDGVEARINPVVVDAETVDGAGIADIVIVFTKTGATKAALQAATPVIGPDTRLVTVQNGLGNTEALAAFVPMDQVIYGTTMAPGDMVAPGVVSTHGSHVTQFCAAGENPVTGRMADDLAAMLSSAGIDTRVNPDVDQVIWAKVAFNCAMNSLCALLDTSPGQLLDSGEMKALVKATIMECCDVAAAVGVEVDRDGVHQTLDMVHREHREHVPSMLVDFRNCQPTEIASLNGAVVALGARHGVPTPRNETLLALVRAREAQYLQA